MAEIEWINRIYKTINGEDFCLGGYVDVGQADYWCSRFQSEEQKRTPGSPATFEVRREQRSPRKPE